MPSPLGKDPEYRQVQLLCVELAGVQPLSLIHSVCRPWRGYKLGGRGVIGGLETGIKMVQSIRQGVVGGALCILLVVIGSTVNALPHATWDIRD